MSHKFPIDMGARLQHSRTCGRAKPREENPGNTYFSDILLILRFTACDQELTAKAPGFFLRECG